MTQYELKENRVVDFFDYAMKRYEIFLKKEAGAPKPWTTEEAFLNYRFCNVFREDDKVTRWFRENIRGPLADDTDVVFATVAFRWFNRISSGEVLKSWLVEKPGRWDSAKVKEELLAALGTGPYITGAYMIKTPTGMNKLDGVLACIDTAAATCEAIVSTKPPENGWRLEQIWQKFLDVPFLGVFLAYELVTDLRHTYLLRNAADINTWANPGPGAARGLCRILDIGLYDIRNTSVQSRELLNDLMRRLLQESENYWPAEWPKWEMREVEHTLCEFDKYERVLAGEGNRMKQKYNGRI